MSDPRPRIDDGTKRAVRQRCGFGCVVCGLPIFEYDHIVPWAEEREHKPENLVLLCAQHHAEKTRGLLPAAVVREAAERPYNTQRGRSAPLALSYRGSTCTTEIGSNSYAMPALSVSGCAFPLMVDDTPIVGFEYEDGVLRLMVQLFDDDNELLVQVVENELVYSAAPWDVEFVGQRLTVRNAPRDIFVRLRFSPPDHITIERAHFWRNGFEIDVGPAGVELVQSRNVMRNCSCIGTMVGIGIGDCPQVGIGIHFQGMRTQYSPGKSEDRVIRVRKSPLIVPT